jgi:hypothetical protein
MKNKFIFIIFINLLILITLSCSQAYDYFGFFVGPEKTNMLFFKVVNKDSSVQTCFLTSPDLAINNLEANNFALTSKDFFYSVYSNKIEIDIQTRKKTSFYDGGGPIDGFVGKVNIFKLDNETLKDLDKYCGTYYSIDKKDSIVIKIQDSLSLITTHGNQSGNKKEENILFPTNSELFISKIGLNFQFKLQNSIPWQIMYLFEGHEYFFYKEL